MTDLTELNTLERYLWEHNIPWDGLLEISGSLVDETKTGDSVEGYLFASEIIERLEKEA